MRTIPISSLSFILLFFLHTLPTFAFPQPSDFKGRAVASPQARHPNGQDKPSSTPPFVSTPNYLLADPCGPPTGQANGISGSRSTCNANATADLPSDSPFRVGCLKDTTGYTINWNSCRGAVNAACALLASSTNPPLDQWIWAPAPGTSPTGSARNCTLGFWNPSHGALPSFSRCRDAIFGQMIDTCERPQGSAYGLQGVNVVSVNLKRLPHRTAEERDTGEAVNPNYPSYIIVAQNWVKDAMT